MVKTSRQLIMLITSLPLSVLAADFSAHVDRQQLAPHESLTLTLTLNNADIRLRAEGLSPNIDLSPLHKDFDVGVPKANFRYNIYQGRGRSSSELSVTLHPKQAGHSTIPAFEINGEKTQPIALQIISNAETDQASDAFVQAGTTHQGPLWVGQQLVVYLDILHRIDLNKAKLSDILETEPTRIELLPHWQLPQHKTQRKHQGYEYQVQRMSWAIFPQEAGLLNVYLPSTRINFSNGKTLNFSHQKLVFDVKALPADLPKDIIIGRPEVRLEALPPSFNQHELQSWTVTIDAPVEVSGLPNFLPSLTLAQELQPYPDKAIRDTVKTHLGISDHANYSQSIIASASGEFSIPQQLIPYFDPSKGQLNHVTIPSQHFTVSPAAISVNTQTLLTQAPPELKQVSQFTVWHIATFTLALSNLFCLRLLFKRKKQPQPTIRSPLNSNETKQNSPIANLLRENKLDSLEALLTHLKSQADFSPDNELYRLTKQLQSLAYGKNQKKGEIEIEGLCRTISQKIVSLTEKKQDAYKNKWLPEETLR